MGRIVAWVATALLLVAGCDLQQGGLGPRSGRDGGSDAGLEDGGPGLDAELPDATGDDSGIDAEAPDAGGDAGCTPGGATCSGGVAIRCRGDGTPEMEVCALGCAASGDRCLRAVPSNVPSTLVRPEVPPLALAGAYDTRDCPGGMIVAQPSGPELCVLSVSTAEITGTVAVIGSRPLVIIASGAVHISGTLDVSGELTEPGPGGGKGGVASAPTGGGRSGGQRGGSSSGNADGGAGGGGLCGRGGNGGQGSSIAGGPGGAAIAPGWELSPLEGGSGGGWGRGNTSFSAPPDTSADGGAGGGAVQIFSVVSIDVPGSILAGGGGGEAGLRHPDPSVNYGAGGGGGSGGAVLLEAPMVTIPGRVLASGGGGGGSASDGGDGRPGENGRGATGRAAGGPRGGSMFGADGGPSGGGPTPDGVDGSSNTNSFANGGGGGGGAGCILVRNAAGVLPAGTYSPSLEPALRALPVRTE